MASPYLPSKRSVLISALVLALGLGVFLVSDGQSPELPLSTGPDPTISAQDPSDGWTTLVNPPLRSDLPTEPRDAVQSLQVTVHVVNAASAESVPDAVVELLGKGEVQIGTAITNEDGVARFKLEDFQSGSFIVRASSSFLEAQIEYATESAQTSESVDLYLYLNTRRTKNFQLLSFYGIPFSDVEVFSPFPDNVFRQNALVPVIPLGAPIARSNSEGKFAIADATGKGTLHFRFPSGTRGLAMVDFTSSEDCVISFPLSRSVKVLVTGDLGSPVPDARVRYLSSEINNGSRSFVRFWGREGETDALGEFILGEVEEGPYGRMRLIVEKSGYDAWEGELGEANVLNVELRRSRSVSVTITNPSGAPISDATALVWTARFAEGAWAETMPSAVPESWIKMESNSEGKLFFLIHSLLPHAALLIQADGFATGLFWPVEFPQNGSHQSLALVDEAPTTIRLIGDSRPKDYLYRLTILDRRPLPHSNGVTFTSRPTLVCDVLPPYTVTIRPDEVLELKQLSIGTYGYLLEAIQDANDRSEGEFMAGTGLIEIPIPTGKQASHLLSGTVTSSLHSLPLPGARVKLIEAAPGTKSYTTSADGSGLWRLPGVSPGTYFITWHADGYGLRRRLLNLNAEEGSPSLALTLDETFPVKVYLKSKRGMLHDNTYLFPYLANGDHCVQHFGVGENLVRSAEAIIDEHGCAELFLPRADVYLDLFVDPENVIATVLISAAEVAVGEAHIGLP